MRRSVMVLTVVVLSASLASAQRWNLLGTVKDWTASIDHGGTKMSLLESEGTLVVEIVTDGGTEDFPKIRRTFPQPQDWRPYQLLRAKLRVTCDDPDVRYKVCSFVFYDEQTRLEDYPGKPMKQQVIRKVIPVGVWVEVREWLTQIRRATIRQFDLYLYELPPSSPHRFRWEVASLTLESVGEEGVVFDGEVFGRKEITGAKGKPVGKVATKDGLQLVVGNKGEIAQVQVAGKVLGTATPDAPTGLLVRDVMQGDPPKMVEGMVKQVGTEIHQQAELSDMGLKVSAVYRSVGNYIEVKGSISDTSGKDRAVTVYFALPVSEGAWQWWDSVAIARTEPDERGELHYLETGAGYGLNGAHSKYPLGALTLPEVGGLTLAIRMDEPIVHRIVYNPTLRLFFIALDFGLVPEKRVDGSPLWEAPFRVLLYRHDPKWGFRSALQRYYEFFPQFFVKRVKREGGWYVWGDMSETKGALEAGFAFHWGPRDEKAVKWDNHNGVLALFYIEPQTYQQSHQDFENAPTLTEVLTRLQKLAAGDEQELKRVAQTSYRVYPLAYTGEDVLKRIQETAQVILRSLNYDASQQPYCSVGRYGWMQNRWGAILSCNLAPSIPQGKGVFNIRRVILPALKSMEQAGARYDGIALDSLGGYGEALRANYRREHLRFSRFPLSFSALTRQPVQVAFFTTVEWLQELSRLLHPKGMVFMANCSWGSTPGWLTFAAPYIDIFGAEHPYFADPDFIRAIAYRKPCTDLPYNPRPEWEVAWHMLHAIFPGHGNDLQLLRKYAGILQQLASAGWEPITAAQIQPTFLRLERYGSGKRVCFVAHNPTEQDVEADVRIELSTLRMRDFITTLMPDGKPIEKSGNRIRLSLPTKGTVVLAVEAR